MDKPIIECGTCGGTDAPAGDGDVKHAPTCGFGGDLVHLLDDLVSSCRTEDDDAIWSARDRVISFFSDVTKERDELRRTNAELGVATVEAMGERDEWKRHFEVANAKDHEAIEADRVVSRALGREEMRAYAVTAHALLERAIGHVRAQLYAEQSESPYKVRRETVELHDAICDALAKNPMINAEQTAPKGQAREMEETGSNAPARHHSEFETGKEPDFAALVTKADAMFPETWERMHAASEGWEDDEAMARDFFTDGVAKGATLRHQSCTKLEWALRKGDVLADWCNVSGAALAALMDAFERRARSHCTAAEIEREPWRCSEFIEAERALTSKPVPVVSIDASGVPACAECGALPDEKCVHQVGRDVVPHEELKSGRYYWWKGSDRMPWQPVFVRPGERTVIWGTHGNAWNLLFGEFREMRPPEELRTVAGKKP